MIKFLSKIFSFAIKSRNNNFDKGKRKTVKVSVPVISIGNLSVGGTGKTPFVIMTAKYLRKKGLKAAIIGRGYKRKSKGLVVVSDGENIKTKADQAGDEMQLAAIKTGFPVVVCESKTEAAQYAAKEFNIDCIIVDDGFQHRGLARDLDVLIIDKLTVEKPELLPKGRLREPLENATRADIICLADGLQEKQLNGKIDSSKSKVVSIQGKLQHPFHLDSERKLKLSEFKQAKTGIITVTGIAKPYRFINMLEKAGFKIKETVKFSDHHMYNTKSINRIVASAKKNKSTNIACTEKDYVKLIEFKDEFIKNNLNVYVFPFEMSVNPGFAIFKRALLDILIGENK